MYRSWHLGRGPGEPPPARGMCTFSGISKGQGGESRWDSGGEPKMPYWSQGHWNRSSLEGISEIFWKQRTSQKDETHSKLMDQMVVPGSQVFQGKTTLFLLFNDGHDTNPIFSGEEEKSPSFSLGGVQLPWHTRDAVQHLQDKKGPCSVFAAISFPPAHGSAHTNS